MSEDDDERMAMNEDELPGTCQRCGCNLYEFDDVFFCDQCLYEIGGRQC